MKWVLYAGAALVCLGFAMTLIGVMLPKTHTVSRSARFEQTPEALYALLSGPPTWRTDIDGTGKLTETTWWERNKRGRKVIFELVEDRPPSKRVIRIADKTLPFSGQWTIKILPEGSAATVQIREDGEIPNALFRFMARFIFGYAGTIEGWLRDLRNVEQAGVLKHGRPAH